MPFQQLPKEARRGMPIALGLHKDVDHVAILVNRPPEILLPPPDVHEQLVQIPGVAQTPALSPQRTRVLQTESPTPVPNALVADRDAPLGQQVLRIAEAEAEAMVEPARLMISGGNR